MASPNLTEAELSQVVLTLGRGETTAPSSAAGGSLVPAFTFADLCAFAATIRTVPCELTTTLLNKMYFTATSRAAATAEDLGQAQQNAQYGEDWKSFMRHVLRAADALAQSASAGKGRRSSNCSPRKTAAANTSSSRSPRRREAVPFPPWSVHSATSYSDNFDALRANQEGMCLQDAKQLQFKLSQSKIVRPNFSGAIIVPNSPRNGGAAIVIVDSDVAVNPNGVHPIEAVYHEATLSESRKARLPPRDDRYNETMTKLVQYLSSPRAQ